MLAVKAKGSGNARLKKDSNHSSNEKRKGRLPHIVSDKTQCGQSAWMADALRGARARGGCGARGSELRRLQDQPGGASGKQPSGRRGWGFAGGAEFVSRITGSASRARSPPRQAALVARGSPARAGEGRAGRPAPRDIRFPVTLSEPNFLNSLGELAGTNEFPICRSAQNTRRTFFVVPPPPPPCFWVFMRLPPRHLHH